MPTSRTSVRLFSWSPALSRRRPERPAGRRSAVGPRAVRRAASARPATGAATSHDAAASPSRSDVESGLQLRLLALPQQAQAGRRPVRLRPVQRGIGVLYRLGDEQPAAGRRIDLEPGRIGRRQFERQPAFRPVDARAAVSSPRSRCRGPGRRCAAAAGRSVRRPALRRPAAPARRPSRRSSRACRAGSRRSMESRDGSRARTASARPTDCDTPGAGSARSRRVSIHWRAS